MERDLFDIVKEHEENGEEVRHWEVDTCGICGCHFLVDAVKPEYADESVCGYKCWTIKNGKAL